MSNVIESIFNNVINIFENEILPAYDYESMYNESDEDIERNVSVNEIMKLVNVAGDGNCFFNSLFGILRYHDYKDFCTIKNIQFMTELEFSNEMREVIITYLTSLKLEFDDEDSMNVLERAIYNHLMGIVRLEWINENYSNIFYGIEDPEKIRDILVEYIKTDGNWVAEFEISVLREMFASNYMDCQPIILHILSPDMVRNDETFNKYRKNINQSWIGDQSVIDEKEFDPTDPQQFIFYNDNNHYQFFVGR